MCSPALQLSQPQGGCCVWHSFLPFHAPKQELFQAPVFSCVFLVVVKPKNQSLCSHPDECISYSTIPYNLVQVTKKHFKCPSVTLSSYYRIKEEMFWKGPVFIKRSGFIVGACHISCNFYFWVLLHEKNTLSVLFCSFNLQQHGSLRQWT